MVFEVYKRARRGRPLIGPQARLYRAKDGQGSLRISAAAREALGTDPRQDIYVILLFDKQTGAIQIKRTEKGDPNSRALSPKTGNITLGVNFFDYTGWGLSTWTLQTVEDGVLEGAVRVPDEESR